MKRRSFLQIVASLPLAPTIARVLVGAGAALAPTTANAGLAFSKFWQRLFGKKEMRILMVGLDAAGKTTILYKLKLGEVMTSTPSEGLNVETVEYKNIGFTVWDLGGPESQRAIASRYYQNTQAIIFVVDSNDSDRMDGAAGAAVSAKSELARLLGEEALRKAILLVFANKRDLPQAKTVAEITECLGLNQIKDRPYYIQATCATTGDGLYEGLDWASQQLAKK